MNRNNIPYSVKKAQEQSKNSTPVMPNCNQNEIRTDAGRTAGEQIQKALYDTHETIFYSLEGLKQSRSAMLMILDAMESEINSLPPTIAHMIDNWSNVLRLSNAALYTELTELTGLIDAWEDIFNTESR